MSPSETCFQILARKTVSAVILGQYTLRYDIWQQQQQKCYKRGKGNQNNPVLFDSAKNLKFIHEQIIAQTSLKPNIRYPTIIASNVLFSSIATSSYIYWIRLIDIFFANFQCSPEQPTPLFSTISTTSSLSL